MAFRRFRQIATLRIQPENTGDAVQQWQSASIQWRGGLGTPAPIKQPPSQTLLPYLTPAYRRAGRYQRYHGTTPRPSRA